VVDFVGVKASALELRAQSWRPASNVVGIGREGMDEATAQQRPREATTPAWIVGASTSG
jgi:hypothetical protein